MGTLLNWIEGLKEYWSTPLLEKDFTERLKDGIKLFGMIGLSCFIVLQFSHFPSLQFEIFFSWGIIGLSFGGTTWVLIEILYFLEKQIFSVKKTVGHDWLSSMIMFLLGYGVFIFSSMYVLPIFYPEYQRFETKSHSLELFIKIVPLYLVVTYIHLQAGIKKGLTASLEQSREINKLLEQQKDKLAQPGEAEELASEIPQFEIARNNETESLSPETISHISVEEHYSSIYVKTEHKTEEIQIRLSLKEALKKLPQKSFIQIHRSHVVNLAHISHIEQQNRSYQLYLGDSNFALPISRHRVSHVLPLLQEFLSPKVA